MRLVKYQVWRLRDDFFELETEDARFAALAEVCVPAEPLQGPRVLPPMSAWEQSIVIGYCSLVALPLGILSSSAICVGFGWWRLLGLTLAGSLTLALQPLPFTRESRRRRVGLLLCKYFALELMCDRDAGPFSAMFGTPAAGCDSQGRKGRSARVSSEAIGRDGPVISCACPHGVMNYGAVAFSFLSRWFIGNEQVTAVASAVKHTPGLRQFAAPLWPVDAGRDELLPRLKERGQTVGIIPDGINGIFARCKADGSGGAGDAVVLGAKRGLMRLALESGAGCMASYFVGTLNIYSIWQDRWGVLRWLSRKTRLSLFLFYGRWGLPIPRRYPITAIGCFVPAPDGAPIPQPTSQQLDEHHERVYHGLARAYEDARAALGLPEGAKLLIK